MKPHQCDENCICPIHGTFLLFVPRADPPEHACLDIGCIYGHGLESVLFGRAR